MATQTQTETNPTIDLEQTEAYVKSYVSELKEKSDKAEWGSVKRLIDQLNNIVNS